MHSLYKETTDTPGSLIADCVALCVSGKEILYDSTIFGYIHCC